MNTTNTRRSTLGELNDRPPHAKNIRPAPAYRPAPTPYTGDGLECVANLDPATPKERLLDVAKWHDRRSGKRSVMIARALREAAGR